MLPFERAVAIAGSKAKLAALIGCSPQAISQWNPERLIPEQCVSIEAATGGRVRCEALRPDVEFQRDADGRVTGYVVRVSSPTPAAAPVDKVA